MQKIFNIPAPDHLVKFATKEFWEGKTAPFPVDEGSLLGKHIFSILIDRRKLDPLYLGDYESELKLNLSNTLAKRSPDLIRLSRINLFLEELFRQCMISWVKAQIQIGSNRYQAVISFLKYYDLQTDEMVDRCYQYIKRKHNLPYRSTKYGEKNTTEKN